ncbi:DinB family protein [Dactylosporangium sp. NPDC051484]|uniref:DinB family protein n=1 Tax=Dactylosporangium sp. NPDC051484 TaxID=3154942 RepID=UPI00344B1F7C
MTFPEPTVPAAGRAEVFLRYLDYFRETLLQRVASLPADALGRSSLPSGWTPLELLNHLRHVERRWLEWGFEGRDVPEPWGDRRDERWYIAPGETLGTLSEQLRRQGETTRAIITGSDLDTIGAPGPRWDGADPPPLERVLFHLLQEYARHAGHIDIVAELAGGTQGE